MHSTKQTPLKHGSATLSIFVLIYNQSPELFTFYRNEAGKQWAGDNSSQPLSYPSPQTTPLLSVTL